MDMYGWQESTDPLYKDIPFLLAMRNGSAYGIFLDNTYRSNFDFGKESRDFYSFGAEGGELDYYFFYGPDPKRVIQDFTGSHRTFSAAAAFCSGLPAVPLQLLSRSTSTRNCPRISLSQNSCGYHLPRYRLSTEQPSLHR
jgi:hypothetical protein